jgi:hypothetical protein
MLAAYDLDNRSSAVLPQTVLSLGFKPTRRVEILTTGRSRRHRGGTLQEELAEAARQRDERAARRARQREEAQQPAPQPEEQAGYFSFREELPVADDVSSDDEPFDDSLGEADISGFREVLDQAQGFLRENPVAAEPAGVPAQIQVDESARRAVVDVADTDSDDGALTPAEEFFDELRARLNTDSMSPEEWWDAHVEAVTDADVQYRVALATQLRDDLLAMKQDADLPSETQRYFHERWAEMPEIIADLRQQAEYQQRRPRGRAALQRFIDDAESSRQLEGDVRFRPRGSIQRSPSPIRTPGFGQSGRFSDEESTIEAIRGLSRGIVADPRLDREVSRIQGELSATQDMLQDLQLADTATRAKTIDALKALTDASKKQIIKDRKLAPAEIAIVARNIKDRPAVRMMLQQGLVRPSELVDESYASRLQIQTDTERKLPRRRTSTKQVMLDRESVPSRSTRGLKYYRRAQYVRPDIWR